MGLSSNILWHQTNKKSFYEILNSKKLLYSYCQERIILAFKLKPVAFPMISLSDYPLSEINHNKWAYGNYCIGFKQKWGVEAGFSPVWYCSYGSRGIRQLNILLAEAIKNNSKYLNGVIMYMFANMKLVDAPLETKNKIFNQYRFYDEREWRLVPYITETDKAGVLPYLTDVAYKKYKDEHDNSSLLEIGVDFQYDDISYIIVETDSEVQKARDIVGNKIHIFTKAEVIEDVEGVDHDGEIIISQEKQDIEAARRQLDRIKKAWIEAAERRKTKSNGK